MAVELKTTGHACLIILDDGVPVLATDPWVIGSAYWGSWWLERYPPPDEMDLVKTAQHHYITHSHPDHFHYPSLRHLQPRSTLHPRFPDYVVPGFLEAAGYAAHVLEPWCWYSLNDRVRIASIPTLIDDSILVIDTPSATVVNLNDASPRRPLLTLIRDRLCSETKPVIVLKSYAPASSAVATFKDGRRVPLKSKRDYGLTVNHMAAELGAVRFIPFASQAFFNRRDSRWANEYKVTYEDLKAYWVDPSVSLCPPFVTMNLTTLDYTSRYGEVDRSLAEAAVTKVRAREAEEAAFELPSDFDSKLKSYLDKVYFLRLLFRQGVGWRLTSTGAERFYNTRTGIIEHAIPDSYDFIISLPDKVLYEALQNAVLTDLGITMFIRVDTKINLRLTYTAFLLMGLRDYGHFSDARSFLRFVRFYLPYVFPVLLRARGPRDHQVTPIEMASTR